MCPELIDRRNGCGLIQELIVEFIIVKFSGPNKNCVANECSKPSLMKIVWNSREWEHTPRWMAIRARDDSLLFTVFFFSPSL